MRLVCIVPLILASSFGLWAQPATGDAATGDRVRQLVEEAVKLGEFEIEGGVKVRTRIPVSSETIGELRKMGDPGVDALREMLVNCAGSSRRRIVVESLGRIGGRKAVEALVLAAKTDPDPGIRQISLIWLKEIAGDRAEPTLRFVKENDPVKWLRDEAGRLLGGGGTRQ